MQTHELQIKRTKHGGWQSNSYVTPDVVMAEKASDLSHGERSVTVGIRVPGQHTNTQRLNVRIVQKSTIKINAYEYRLY